MDAAITKKLIHPRKHGIPASKAFIDILYKAIAIGIITKILVVRDALIRNSSFSILSHPHGRAIYQIFLINNSPMWLPSLLVFSKN